MKVEPNVTTIRNKKDRRKVYKDEEVRAEIIFERVVSEAEGKSRQSRSNIIKEYLGSLATHPVLRDAEEFNRLFDVWKNSVDEHKRAEAQATLVYGNIRLVLSIAMRNTNRGLDLEDLMQEGVTGVMRALESYEPEKGRFSTYATWWIRQAISRAIQDSATSRPYRVPVHMQESVERVKKAIRAVTAERHRAPGSAEVLKILQKSGLPEADKITLQKVEACMALLDERYSHVDHEAEGEEHAHRDKFYVPAKAATPLTEAMAREELSRQQSKLKSIAAALETLDPRLRTIMRLRLGLIPGLPALSLQEIGDRYGITRSRTQQLEAKGLELLQQQGLDVHMEGLP